MTFTIGGHMTRDDVVALLARRMEAADRRDWASLRKLYADYARTESPLSGSVHGPDAIVTALEAFYVAFPDAVIATQPPIVDGNRAVVPGEVTGTNAGDFMGLPPSGRTMPSIAC